MIEDRVKCFRCEIETKTIMKWNTEWSFAYYTNECPQCKLCYCNTEQMDAKIKSMKASKDRQDLHGK